MDSKAPPSSRTSLPLRRPTAAQPTVADEATARLLLAGTSRQVLSRIVPGDPLGLRRRLAEHVRSRALFVDVDHVLTRAQARIAREAPRWRGRPALEPWLQARLDEAIADRLDEESSLEVDPGPPSDSVLALLAEPLGLSPVEMARGCARFNGLRKLARQAFFALVVEGQSLERAADRLARAPLDVAHLAREALDVFRAEDPERSAETSFEGPGLAPQQESHQDPHRMESSPHGTSRS